MSALDLLRKYSKTSGESIAIRPGRPSSSEADTTELPADINHWPQQWRARLNSTSAAIKRLLPIEELHAEAAAEISIRLEYTRQANEGS